MLYVGAAKIGSPTQFRAVKVVVESMSLKSISCSVLSHSCTMRMAIDGGLGQRNALDLNIDVLGQCLDGDTAAGRLVYKPFGVLLIHGLIASSARPSVPQHKACKDSNLTTKLSMSAKKMLTLTTFSMLEPAAVSTALRFLMHCPVFSWMVPWTKLPSASRGIWPEQYMAVGVLMAWDCDVPHVRARKY